jgi:hypothetical protein
LFCLIVYQTASFPKLFLWVSVYHLGKLCRKLCPHFLILPCTWSRSISFVLVLKMMTFECSCVEVYSSQLTRLYSHCGWQCELSTFVVVGSSYITCEGARVWFSCSVPDQGVLDPVSPSDRDLTCRQPSGNLLPWRWKFDVGWVDGCH